MTLLQLLSKQAESEIKCGQQMEYTRKARLSGSHLARAVSGGFDGEPALLARQRHISDERSYYKLSRKPGSSDKRYHG